MPTINIKPLPPRDGRGVGYWTEFLENLDAVVAFMEENTVEDDSHDSSSDSSEVVNLFNPDSFTVTEFRTAVVAIRASISDVI